MFECYVWFVVRCCMACFFVLLCLCVLSLNVIMRFVCDLLCDAVCGVCVILCGSFV